MRHDGILRALAILRAMQDRPRTLQELAAAHHVTTRTIRRDFDVLSLGGFPVFNHEFEHTAGRWGLLEQDRCPLCDRRMSA